MRVAGDWGDGVGTMDDESRAAPVGFREAPKLRGAPTIAGYRFEEELGEGGMGKVFRAFDEEKQRMVAVKVLPAAVDDELLSRFMQEAEIGALVEHPDIIHIYGCGRSVEAAWIAMEYLDGYELDAVAAEPSFTLEERIQLLVRIAVALSHAHDRGVVHRDIKPSNIFVTRDGGVRLLDFGIAKIKSRKLTRPGMVLGTPRYVAPEQANGGVIDGRADQYALGVLAYHLLAGSHAWTAESPMALVMAKEAEPPRPFREAYDRDRFYLTVPELELLHRIVHRAMATDAADRYPSCLEFAKALEGFSHRSQELDASGAARVGKFKVDPGAWAARSVKWAERRAKGIRAASQKPTSGDRAASGAGEVVSGEASSVADGRSPADRILPIAIGLLAVTLLVLLVLLARG